MLLALDKIDGRLGQITERRKHTLPGVGQIGPHLRNNSAKPSVNLRRVGINVLWLVALDRFRGESLQCLARLIA